MKWMKILKKHLSLKAVTILLCGIIFSLSCGAMWVSKSFNLDCFYDIGKVYDIGYMSCITADQGMMYLGTGRKMSVTEDTAGKTIVLEGEMRTWNTLVLELDDMNQESMEWQLEFYDRAGVLTGTRQIAVTSGKNIIFLEGQTFSQMKYIINHSVGSTFAIQKMQLLEGTQVTEASQYWRAALLFFLVYIIAVGAAGRLYKKFRTRKLDFYYLFSKLQDIYLSVGNILPSLEQVPGKYCSVGRRLLFLGMLYYMLVINNKDTYFTTAYYPRHILVFGLFLFGIAVLSKEGELKKQNWHLPYMKIWAILWIVICTADFIVKKRFTGWGWLMLLVVGFLLFIWQNMGKPGELFRDLLKSIEYFSFINLIFCFIARPKLEWYGYCGITWNPNIYIQYLMPMCVAAFAELLEWIEKEKRGTGWIFHLIMIIVAFYMNWISESRTGLLTLALIFLIFIGAFLLLTGQKKYRKNCWKAIVTCTVLIIPVSFFCGWCIQNIPQKLGTQVIFPRDEYQIEVGMPSLTLNAEAAGLLKNIKENLTAQKILPTSDMEMFTSSRNLYWNAYLRNMNLWGHPYQLEIWGKGRLEHSGFIIIAYRYGVFTLVPYLLYLGLTFKYAWKYLRYKGKEQIYRFYPIGITVGMLCILLVENVERPFYSVSCLAFYLLPGVFLSGQQWNEETKCRKKTTELPATRE